jgi:hypothetical protein
VGSTCKDYSAVIDSYEVIITVYAIFTVTTMEKEILTFYRALSANFDQFIKRLDGTLKYLYNPNSQFLICVDINVNYLNDNNQKSN